MNRRILRCRGVSARSAPRLDGPPAVVLLIRPSHRTRQFPGTILDVKDRKQKRVLEKGQASNTLPSAWRSRPGAAGSAAAGSAAAGSAAAGLPRPAWAGARRRAGRPAVAAGTDAAEAVAFGVGKNHEVGIGVVPVPLDALGAESDQARPLGGLIGGVAGVQVQMHPR